MENLTTTRTVCTCGCEYLTTILYKPAFRDAEPKCPCCGGEGATNPQMYICDHAKYVGCNPKCPLNTAHTCNDDCGPTAEYCPNVGLTVRCVPVADGKEG